MKLAINKDKRSHEEPQFDFEIVGTVTLSAVAIAEALTGPAEEQERLVENMTTEDIYALLREYETIADWLNEWWMEEPPTTNVNSGEFAVRVTRKKD